MSKKTKKKQKAIELLESKGLVYASNETQKANGTLYFIDPKTMVGYSITKSGYCRRHRFGDYYAANKLGEVHYQLNKTVRRWRDGRITTKRILEPGKYVKLAKQLLNPIENYRKNL